MPIQRIPRYKMLLKEVIKNTEEGHPDLPDLHKATEAIAKVAKHINEEVTKAKNREKILELEGLFQGNVELVHPARVFIRHGALVKKCRASNRVYEFFLFNNLMVYASASGFGKLKLHRRIEINNSFHIQELPDKPAKSPKEQDEVNRFQIVSASKSFVVMASSKAEKKEWIDAILKQIDRLKVTIGGRRKALEMQRRSSQFEASSPAPVWQSDQSSTECNICSRKFTMWTRRHHCRFCGILVCNSCSLKRLLVPVTEGSSKKESKRICDKCAEDFEEQCSSRSGLIARRESALSLAGNTSPNSPQDSRALMDEMGKVPTIPEETTGISSGDVSEKSGATYTTANSPDIKDLKNLTGLKVDEVQESPLSGVEVNLLTAVSEERELATLLGICRILYPYEAEAEGELDCDQGEIIQVYEAHANGWWNGVSSSSGKSGWFPSSYVKPLKRYKAQYTFEGENETDVSFQINDDVFILDAPDTHTWWSAYVGGKIGNVPSNYISEAKDLLQEALDAMENNNAPGASTGEAKRETSQPIEACSEGPMKQQQNDGKEGDAATPGADATRIEAPDKIIKGITTAEDTSSDSEPENVERIRSRKLKIGTLHNVAAILRSPQSLPKSMMSPRSLKNSGGRIKEPLDNSSNNNKINPSSNSPFSKSGAVSSIMSPASSVIAAPPSTTVSPKTRSCITPTRNSVASEDTQQQAIKPSPPPPPKKKSNKKSPPAPPPRLPKKRTTQSSHQLDQIANALSPVLPPRRRSRNSDICIRDLAKARGSLTEQMTPFTGRRGSYSEKIPQRAGVSTPACPVPTPPPRRSSEVVSGKKDAESGKARARKALPRRNSRSPPPFRKGSITKSKELPTIADSETDIRGAAQSNTQVEPPIKNEAASASEEAVDTNKGMQSTTQEVSQQAGDNPNMDETDDVSFTAKKEESKMVHKSSRDADASTSSREERKAADESEESFLDAETKKRADKVARLEKLIASLPDSNVKALKAKAQLAQLKAEDQMALNKKQIYARREKSKGAKCRGRRGSAASTRNAPIKSAQDCKAVNP
eukprot:CAMPEP_0184481608 /NCGR_PEP_ID=MMETSP0113_2-20130426/3159_1 /TAXON_ID=91329 /ORGANISM="Norrisiella sphaerica, Strain BC52" /LENGTH=1048 /DNA_ID=CAMNT_0026860827 /DNA_START=708 /DNA_END=3854 /DNA_ORIENTATION=+